MDANTRLHSQKIFAWINEPQYVTYYVLFTINIAEEWYWLMAWDLHYRICCNLLTLKKKGFLAILTKVGETGHESNSQFYQTQQMFTQELNQIMSPAKWVTQVWIKLSPSLIKLNLNLNVTLNDFQACGQGRSRWGWDHPVPHSDIASEKRWKEGVERVKVKWSPIWATEFYLTFIIKFN